MDNYSVLRSKIQKVQKLRLIDETLKWDQEVVMPPESGLQRSELLSELSAVMHEKISSDEVGQLIAEARKEALSSEWDRRNLDLIEREYRFAKALPKKLVEAVALQSVIVLRSGGRQSIRMTGTVFFLNLKKWWLLLKKKPKSVAMLLAVRLMMHCCPHSHLLVNRQ